MHNLWSYTAPVVLIVIAFGGFSLVVAERVYRFGRNLRSLRRRQDLYLALARCSTSLTRRSPSGDLFDTICQALAGVVNIRLVFIAQASLAHDTIKSIAARGESLDYVDGIALSRDPSLPEGRGAIGRSVRSGLPVWINDYLTEPMTGPWREAGRKHGFRGSACLPIVHQGAVRYVISIYTDTVGYFDADTRPLLHEFAVQFGLALEARAAKHAAAVSTRQATLAAAQAAIANERLGALIRASSDLITTIDREGRIVSIITAHQVPEAGRNCFDLIEPGSRSERDLRAALQMTDGSQSHSALNLTFVDPPTGRQVPMLVSLVWSEEEQVFYSIARDMSEFRAMEEAWRHSQRLNSLGVLTGGIAHDFNNLLAVVIGNSEFLAERLENPRHRQLAELITSTGQQGARLTEQLLAFARRQPLAPEACDVAAVIHEKLPLLEQALSPLSHLAVSSGEGLPAVVLDKTQFAQVLMNLCLNARDAMPGGGQVTIEIGKVGNLRSRLAGSMGHIPDHFIAVLVSDTGNGIAQADINSIFEPFFTTKGPGKGAGLGLSMAYGFVTQSGGMIDVRSREGRGTTFFLFFPTVDTDAAMPGALPLPNPVHHPITPCRALVVDDNVSLRQHTRRVLEAFGCEVCECSDGLAALELLGSGTAVDLVITDIMLPGGIDGWALGDRIAALPHAICVIYMTGYSASAAPAGIDKSQILHKPFGNHQLAEAIARAQYVRGRADAS